MSALSGHSPEEIRARIVSTDLVRRFESGHMEPESLVEQLCAILEAPIGYERFCEAWSSIFLPEPLIPESLFEGIRQRYRLLLLSNTNALHFKMIRKNYPLLRHFD